jgi:hypothetical protein
MAMAGAGNARSVPRLRGGTRPIARAVSAPLVTSVAMQQQQQHEQPLDFGLATEALVDGGSN